MRSKRKKRPSSRRRPQRATGRDARHRKPQFHKPPDRASNPTIPWLHGLAAMGDERWEEAIVALQRFLEMTNKPEDRRLAFQNLGACYLALERYDEALAALDEVERYAPTIQTPSTAGV